MDASPTGDASLSGDAVPTTWRCRVFGHLLHFRSDRHTMIWECERGCGIIGTKTYESTEQARTYAEGFDRRDARNLGRHAPLLGMFPLRLWHKIRRR